MFTSSVKRGIRCFRVVVVEWRQRNLQKSVLHVQRCCFANLNPLLFRPFSLPSSSSLRKRLIMPPSQAKFTLGSRNHVKANQRERRKAVILFEHLSRAAIHMDMNWILTLRVCRAGYGKRTFWDATSGISSKWRLKNELRNTIILMTRHYPDLGCASDWLKQTSVMKRPIRSTSLFWVVLHYLYGISALVPQTPFRGLGCLGKQAMASRNAASSMEILTLQFSILYYKTISYRD